MFAVWREKFVACRWLLYLLPFDKFNSSRTSDLAVYQNIQKWADENGFQLSIPVVRKFKFLCFIVDKKLTFNKHLIST